MFLYVGTYDPAVITKNEEGKVEIVDKIEKPTRRLGWLEESETALIVVGEATIEEEAIRRTKKAMKKEVRADAREIERAIDSA